MLAGPLAGYAKISPGWRSPAYGPTAACYVSGYLATDPPPKGSDDRHRRDACLGPVGLRSSPGGSSGWG